MKNYIEHTHTRLQKKFSRTYISLIVLGAFGGVLPCIVAAQESLPEPAAKELAKDPVDDIEIISVTGLRSSVIASQARKLDSDKIMDGITADDMSALPDNSITETLQRVVGVTIDRYMQQDDPEHFSVEGNGVAVRGLTQVSSQLNGRSTFSATGGRTLSFGDIPPELMSAVMIYKSPTADQIEGGLGGTIDLETRKPFQQDGQKFAFDIAGNYGDLIEETTPSYSALYSNSWDTDLGRIGFLADYAYSELKTRNDSMYLRPFFTRTDIIGNEGQEVYVPRGADWRSMSFDREREGHYLALQWAPRENHEFTFTYFNSQYDMTWDEDAIFVGNDALAIQVEPGASYDSQGVIEKGRLYQPDIGIAMGSDVRVSTQDSRTQDYSLEYKFYNDSVEFKASAQYVKSSSTGFDSTVATEILVPYIDIDLSASLPRISSDDAALTEVGNYTWNFSQDQLYNREGDMLALQADTKFYIEHDIVRAIKVGVRYTDSSSDNADTGYNWSPLAPSWLNLVDGDPVPTSADVNLNTFDNFFGGETVSPSSVYAPVVSYALDYPNSYAKLNDKFVYDEASSWAYWSQRSLTDPQYQNNQSEKTYAAYLMANFSFEDLPYPIDGNLGVRYVRTENSAAGYLTFPQPDFFGASAYSPTQAENSYSHFLPSFNMKVELAESVLLRFAAAQAIARPDYSQMAANQVLSAGYTEEFQEALTMDPTLTAQPENYLLTSNSDQNPYLEPMKSTQFDLSLEWYYSDSNTAYLALFTKDIDGYQAKQEVTESYGAQGYEQYDYKVTRPVNSGSAKLSGAEISINHFFTSLPTPFNGFGVSANYTYIDSSTDTELDTQPVDTDGSSYGKMPYFGISKNAYNVVAMYELDDFHIRLAYNWRSKYLTSIGANGFNGSNAGIDWKLPVYNEAAGFLDASIAYDITQNISVSLEANNLTNEVSRNIMQQNAPGSQYSAYHYSDSRYTLSIRGRF
ncbi:MAG TPA: TonB-dependent receptor [Pseudoalteromonas prydzensis]|uniref:TonB-dependent receptor n=1 Tax=Pseudoalteromonas prydzensis TaxID=182141 RepID=A0A7V1CXV2_9GAMM|nr:TonB-dependent receptor [Pseudoalteromonas prydzensis]HEA16338.1 TonB-dependent receptor [Pseudoalteromonas prydzensis]